MNRTNAIFGVNGKLKRSFDEVIGAAEDLLRATVDETSADYRRARKALEANVQAAKSQISDHAEEIVSEDDIRRHPDRTVIPGFVVDALAHVPFGSYPHECYGAYDAEPDHFTTYVEGIQQRGAAGVAEYLERYVYTPRDHAGYLALFGEARMVDAAARARMLTT